MSEKYKIGTKVSWVEEVDDRLVEFVGEVIPTFKLPEDICIIWNNGLSASYDEKFLDENVKIIGNKNVQ